MNVKVSLKKSCEHLLLCDRAYLRLHAKRVVGEMRASQKREREMFKAMADGCAWHDIRLMCHRNKDDGPATKCTKRNCPLLKGGGK